MISNQFYKTVILILVLLCGFLFKTVFAQEGSRNEDEVQKIAKQAYLAAKDERYAESIKLYNKAVLKAPDEGELIAVRGGVYAIMGQYDHSLDDMKKAVQLGASKWEIYVTLLTRVLRQIKNSVPSKSWKPNYDAYHTVVELSWPPIGGAKWLSVLTGTSGTCLQFGGNEKESIEFFYKYWVWNGAWINDPEKGLLLVNGTQFKREVIEGNKRILLRGEIRDWRPHVLTKRTESVRHKK